MSSNVTRYSQQRDIDQFFNSGPYYASQIISVNTSIGSAQDSFNLFARKDVPGAFTVPIPSVGDATAADEDILTKSDGTTRATLRVTILKSNVVVFVTLVGRADLVNVGQATSVAQRTLAKLH